MVRYSIIQLCYAPLLLRLISFMQVYHAQNKSVPRPLLSIVNAWKTDRLETLVTADAKTNELTFISGISEEVSSQLHSGILKTARRVVLDEIISNIIAQFVITKKAQRQPKPQSHGMVIKTNYWFLFINITSRLIFCFDSLNFLDRIIVLLPAPHALLLTKRLMMETPFCLCHSLNLSEALKIFGGHMHLFASYFFIVAWR